MQPESRICALGLDRSLRDDLSFAWCRRDLTRLVHGIQAEPLQGNAQAFPVTKPIATIGGPVEDDLANTCHQPILHGSRPGLSQSSFISIVLWHAVLV